MTTNNFKLESGQEYSVNQIFSGFYKIIIPDLQRDYCWGDKAWNKEMDNYTELVSGFTDNLISYFTEKPNEKMTLGLIYGYENPHFSIQLCDGQQRLTTLFLLVGMLNRRTDKNFFKNILISESELKDDKEPNLQYAIRESTLYFLSDLVCEFFLNNRIKIEDLKKQNWYFKEYDQDASIQSMLCAIKTIDERISNIDCEEFGVFIINNLQMLYYDMGHRTRGEETFVIINTTGEPLSATENLKPILIGNINNIVDRERVSKEWEDREEWLWQNKRENEQTSDNALKDFFVWYWQIRLLQEKSWKGKMSYTLNPNELFQKKPLIVDDQEEVPEIDKWENSKNLDIVNKYFLALKLLIEKCKESKIEKVLQTINNAEISLSWFRSSKSSLDVVLPLIAYVEKFNDKNLYQFVRRLRKNYFDNIFHERKSNYLDWRHIIQIIEFSKSNEEVLIFNTNINKDMFKKIPNVSLNEWCNQDEKQKNRFKVKLNDEIEIWEDHQDFMGDLSLIFQCVNSENCTFDDLKKCFTNYVNVIDQIREKSKNAITNIYRLFLLLAECESVEHKPRVSWHIEGVIFSKISRNHLSNVDFWKLIKQDQNNLINFCLAYIKSKIHELQLFDLDVNNFTTSKALKTWLTLKAFYAYKNDKVLSYYDGNNQEEGVSIYKSADDNKLFSQVPFSIYNYICGFGVKAGGGGSYIEYTHSEYWLKPNIINTPFDGILINEENRSIEQLKINKRAIEETVEYINSLLTKY